MRHLCLPPRKEKREGGIAEGLGGHELEGKVCEVRARTQVWEVSLHRGVVGQDFR